MATKLNAIETRYKGYRFRSRLEARWAVFFDTLGILWEYEKEGFDLGESGWYLPDFWLPTLETSYSTGMWAEVKPLGAYESEKLESLVRLSELPAALLSGPPLSIHERSDESYIVYSWHDAYEPPDDADIEEDPFSAEAYGEHVGWDHIYDFCECLECHGVYFHHYGSNHKCDDCGAYIEYSSPRIINAYTAAKSARFEHGERG